MPSPSLVDLCDCRMPWIQSTNDSESFVVEELELLTVLLYKAETGEDMIIRDEEATVSTTNGNELLHADSYLNQFRSEEYRKSSEGCFPDQPSA